jgi:hypothetical protein
MKKLSKIETLKFLREGFTPKHPAGSGDRQPNEISDKEEVDKNARQRKNRDALDKKWVGNTDRDKVAARSLKKFAKGAVKGAASAFMPTTADAVFKGLDVVNSARDEIGAEKIAKQEQQGVSKSSLDADPTSEPIEGQEGAQDGSQVKDPTPMATNMQQSNDQQPTPTNDGAGRENPLTQRNDARQQQTQQLQIGENPRHIADDITAFQQDPNSDNVFKALEGGVEYNGEQYMAIPPNPQNIKHFQMQGTDFAIPMMHMINNTMHTGLIDPNTYQLKSIT